MPPRAAVKSIDEARLRAVIASVTNWAAAARALGVSNGGPTAVTVKKRCAELGINTDHFVYEVSHPGKGRAGRQMKLEKLFERRAKLPRTATFRDRLIKEGILRNECYRCQQKPEWLGQPLSLMIARIDLDATNNRPENLQLLCPNCHAQIVLTKVGGIGAPVRRAKQAAKKQQQQIAKLNDELKKARR